jgi:hypothetical protein
VAGAIMNQIESVAEHAPPINALITRPSGIPGRGFGGFYDRLCRAEGGRRWEKLARARRLEVVEEIRVAVRKFDKWDAIYRTLYGTDPRRAVIQSDLRKGTASLVKPRGGLEQGRATSIEC